MDVTHVSQDLRRIVFGEIMKLTYDKIDYKIRRVFVQWFRENNRVNEYEMYTSLGSSKTDGSFEIEAK